MQALKKIGILLLIVIATTMIIRSQDSKKSISLKQQTIDQDDIPVAKFDAVLPTDVEEKKIREKRKKRFNMKLGPETGVFDSKRFMLSDQMNSNFGGFPSHAPALAAIPAAESDVVIRGEVTKSNASLSEDKTFIFSEFTVKVNNILKNSTSQEIGFENLITVIRGGGAVRFPSGKIIKRLIEGTPMPHIGSEYILFLDYNDEGNDYEIITAYELNDGQILPLDGLKSDGGIVRQLKSHQSYKGTSETNFLNIVQQAINNSEDLFEKKGGFSIGPTISSTNPNGQTQTRTLVSKRIIVIERQPNEPHREPTAKEIEDFDTLNTPEMNRARRIARFIEARNLLLEKGFLSQSDELSEYKWREDLIKVARKMPDFQKDRRTENRIEGVQLARTLTLPADVELTGDTVIIVDRLFYEGGGPIPTGKYKLYIFDKVSDK